MTWDAFHTRGEVLRSVIAEADRRRDGRLPMDLPGVAEVFEDELDLVAALQLRWHTRLSGRIEQALMEEPSGLRSAVLSGWRATADDLPGVREILDACSAEPTSSRMATALTVSHRKDWVLMAVMAGRASASDANAVRIGRELENQARSVHNPSTASHRETGERRCTLLSRVKAHLAA